MYCWQPVVLVLTCGSRCLTADTCVPANLALQRLTVCMSLFCRENSGYYRSTLQLQAFLQIVVGEEKMKSAKQLVTDRHAEP